MAEPSAPRTSPLSKMVPTSVDKEAHITNFFEALRELRRVEAELETPYGKGDALLAARAKELRGYRDVFLKAEAAKRPRFTVLDRRADPNAPTKVELHFTNAVQFYEALDLSLSKGGLFIKTEALLPIDTVMEADCRLEEEEVKFRVSAKVIWLNPRETQGRPIGMGLKLFRLSSIQRQVLADFMHGDMPAATLAHLTE